MSDSPAMGQGTLEYALVTIGFFAAVAALSFLLRALLDGPAAELVLDSLTHRLPKGVIDVVLF